MNGIFLQGGGAKGAYQAGVITALKDLGIEIDVISGTSIGAINGYFIFTDNIDSLKDYWMEFDLQGSINPEDLTIDNSFLFEYIEKIKGKDRDKDFYVNYTKVDGKRLSEVSVNLKGLEKDEAIDNIRFSAMLPKPSTYNLTEDDITQYNSRELFELFKIDLINGRYDGCNLDGSIMNNEFLMPFIEKKVDILFIISFIKDFKIPDYIKESYEDSQIIDLSPDFKFEKYHTVNFDKNFIKEKYEYGYAYAMDKMKA